MPVSGCIEDAEEHRLSASKSNRRPQLTIDGLVIADRERRARHVRRRRARAGTRHLHRTHRIHAAFRRAVVVASLAAVVAELANDQNAFRHLRKRGDVRGDPLHHDRPAHSALADLEVGQTVNVRMVPIETGRLRCWNRNGIVNRPSGFRKHRDDVVRGPARRDVQAVEMKVDVAGRAFAGRELVVEVDDDRIAGVHPDRRSDVPSLVKKRRQSVRGVDDRCEFDRRYAMG